MFTLIYKKITLNSKLLDSKVVTLYGLLIALQINFNSICNVVCLKHGPRRHVALRYIDVADADMLPQHVAIADMYPFQVASGSISSC